MTKDDTYWGSGVDKYIMRIFEIVQHWYHGSPNPEKNFSDSKKIYFFTNKMNVAKEYATGSVFGAGDIKYIGNKSPTIYECNLGNLKIFDMSDRRYRDVYNNIRQEHNAMCDADERLPRLDSTGFIGNTGYPSYGYIIPIIEKIKSLGYNSILVEEGSQGFSLAVFDINSVNVDILNVIGI